MSPTRLAALIHDALRTELETIAETGGQIHLDSVRSLFRQWEFLPGEVRELFCRAAESIHSRMNANADLKISRVRQHDLPQLRISPEWRVAGDDGSLQSD